MPFKYKINVIEELKRAGYSTYRIRKDKIISESTLTRFRNGDPCAIEVLEVLCKILKKQPGDILEYIEE